MSGDRSLDVEEPDELFGQWLRAAPAPPPPPVTDFRRQLHSRVNRLLLAAHLVEFGVQVLPYALKNLCEALLGWLGLTLTGRWPTNKSDSARR